MLIKFLIQMLLIIIILIQTFLDSRTKGLTITIICCQNFFIVEPVTVKQSKPYHSKETRRI